MKTLYLVRHAKSDWSITGQPDFDRVLNARGKRNAPLMAEVMRSRVKVLDLILSSPAARAKATAECFSHEFGDAVREFRFEKRIYEATRKELQDIVSELPANAEDVMLCGHNPGLSELATYLTGDILELPTCAIAAIRLEAEQWTEVIGGIGRLLFFEYPRKYD
jgi:phosphohistidine phosphatase